MKLEIRSAPKLPTDPFSLEVVDFGEIRQVFIDGKRTPKFIEEAILFYMDYKGAEYVDAILKEMKRKKRKNER